jgi:hypothetical protein
MSLILEAWDVENNIVSFGSKSKNIREYIHLYLNNGEVSTNIL